ncbi:uncharacterized protein LOC130614719 isoform X2 [Hydractinia symbiolongicarpus]|nr:uncharacterized protein LOC130614719 isoform X2 [Hydractinia symbiolongicarpus]XP_057292145.1 uncharacterized protein LOC130614719 isoform X2 [Hydractinia symbiolongicarpus]XP_057292146.1 uncharacterized protein LOC130614719 isoform X2 [Hydractinia symbiolongicarpus]XP_057292147.1 uncharacterized protein LOC130614719 isoform X2 [Hydractinia symbiolongicarpus]
MKATATVPPFLNFSVRNHHQEQANTVTTSAEGGFAAALRKLAQQAPGFPAPVSHREMRQKSPPTKNAEMISPVLLPHHSMHPGSYISGAPIMAPIPHSFPNSEKTELLMKSPYGHSHESHKELSSRPPVPGIFQFHEREEHHHHRSKERYELHARKPFEQAQFSSAASSAGVVLNSSLKERPSSSIGLVHPQPARKHHDEENNSSVMNSIHYNHRETAMRSLSPADIQRYAPFVGRHHSQSSQPSCPVHGHEPGHQHDEQACRPPGLNFDPARLPRDFALHAQHPRLREEIQLLQQHGRHPLERKDILQSHHALEEDLRRRGLDYRWGLPPHLLDETYRRHLLNGGHEHSGFKEPPHGLYLPPHFYYGGRDYPLPGDQYISHGLPSQAEMLHRHAPVSPRLLEYYRRGDHGFAERTTRNDVEAERRHEERREKERSSIPHTPSLESLKRKNEEIMLAERKRNDEEKMNRELVNNRPKLPFIKGLDYQRNTQKLNDKPLEANSIDSLLKLPDSKTELAAASILANMNRINQSPSSDDVESLNSSSGTENHSLKPLPPKLEETENDTEQSEEKLQYMLSLGLVSHSRKRVLEDDYDRKRWDRKFRKFRGRPKKRSKRENTEESSLNGDARPGSDLDFYSGPMTRHKQQLLQEQETLLEQIQKRHSIDTNEDNNNNNNNSNNEIHSETNNDSKHKNRKSPRNSPNKESRSPFVVSTDKNTTQLEEVNNSSRSNQFTLTSNHDNLSFNNRTHAQESKHSLEQSRLVTMLRDGNSYPQKPNKHERMYQRPQSSQHRDPVEEVKMLDNSLFGRLNEPHESYLRWCGVQQVSQSYAGYQAEYDAKRQQLLQSYEELQRENHNLRQKQNHLDKDMAVYNERRMRIAERRRHMHLSLEGIHHSLRTLSNL